MNIVCYGASVTAQKEQAGYYHALKKLFSHREDMNFFQVSFAASVFDQAGYAFMRSIEREVVEPHICIIDWLTPGAIKFNQSKIEALTVYLLSKSCLPVWVNFPRTDDLQNNRECYRQVKSHCEQQGLPFIDIYEFDSVNTLPIEEVLRDKVHTTPHGAKLYADILANEIDAIDFSSYQALFAQHNVNELEQVPSLLDKEFTLTTGTEITLNFSVSEKKSFELYFLGEIGPYTPLLNLTFLNLVTDEVEEVEVNCLDMWSHYNREKCIKILWKTIPAGEYKLSISAKNQKAILNIDIKKPVDITKYPEDGRLVLPVNQIACNANLTQFNITGD